MFVSTSLSRWFETKYGKARTLSFAQAQLWEGERILEGLVLPALHYTCSAESCRHCSPSRVRCVRFRVHGYPRTSHFSARLRMDSCRALVDCDSHQREAQADEALTLAEEEAVAQAPVGEAVVDDTLERALEEAEERRQTGQREWQPALESPPSQRKGSIGTLKLQLRSLKSL